MVDTVVPKDQDLENCVIILISILEVRKTRSVKKNKLSTPIRSPSTPECRAQMDDQDEHDPHQEPAVRVEVVPIFPILLGLAKLGKLANFWRARSRLYQNEILQENMRLTAFFKLYKICTLLHRCNLKILAKSV